MREKGIIKLVVNAIIFSIVALVGAVSFLNIDSFEKTVIAPSRGGSIDSGIVSIVFRVIIDDNVEKAINILDEKEVDATFFVTGKWCTDHPEILSEMVNKNYEIGNHGYLNRDFSALSFKESLDEIKTTERTIENLCGYKCKLFMPPKGKFSDATLTSCGALGYEMILWSRTAISDDEKEVYELATKEILSGEIVLLSLNEPTLSVLEDIIDYYHGEGLQIKSVSVNIGVK